jgi:phosphoenolpyruvate-protein kinase (PTS system EI component)
MAGDYATALMLLGMGFSSVSVAPNFLSQVKYAIRSTTLEEVQTLAAEASEATSGDAVRKLLEDLRVRLHARQAGDQTASGVSEP